MFKYLKAAFWVREPIPLFGAVPINALLFAGFVALGFGHPGFWLLGSLCEIIYLWAMSSSKRFRHLVDATDLQANSDRKEGERKSIVDKLSAESQAEYKRFQHRYAEAKRLYNDEHHDAETAAANLEHLDSLLFIVGRLLLGKQRLSAENVESSKMRLVDQITRLRAEIATGASLSEEAKETRQRSVEIREQRLNLLENHERSLDEVESHLDQLDAQFNLAVDAARLSQAPDAAKLDHNLISSLMATPSGILIGDSAPWVQGETTASELE